ncbi:transposase, MuDR, MULE transposase domain protein [Tanacetum coccineum]
MSTQDYMQKVVEDVGEDAYFNSGAWVSATNHVNAFGGTVTGCLGDIDNFLQKGKLKQVVAIVKSCSPNALGDLNVTLKDLSGIVPGTINYKVLDMGSYGKDIILDMVFSPSQFSSYWELEKDAMTLLKRIQKFSKTQDIGARTAVYIFSRISFAITRGVGAKTVEYNFQSSTDDEEIKMEDLVEIVQKTTAGSMELDSLKDDQPIQVSSEDETEIETYTETEDTSSQNIKLEEEKAVAEAEATILKAQPLYPNVQQLTKSFIPTKLKELPKREYIMYEKSTGTSEMAKLKVVDAIPDIMNKVAVSLDKFVDVISSASQKAETLSVPSASQVDTHPAEGKKNTNQETIIQLFQRRQAKDADAANLINKH